ncbi:Uncharacterised protein [Mycobacterium tuberculosis]|nr:Uncharacterised protein [Mycobacterium tuberculosis]
MTNLIVILQIPTDTGTMIDNIDSMLPEQSFWPNSRELEKLR